MRTIHSVVTIICLVAMMEPAVAKPNEFTGVPKIIDGDTVQFGEIRLQMEGIDAPQTDQLCFDDTGRRWKCGVAATEHLRKRAGRKSWTCEVVRKTLHGRLLANCRADGQDIANRMVRDGWALASTTGSAAYLATEEQARSSEAGLWSGAFVAPLDWRQRNWHAKIFGNGKVPARSAAPLLTSAFGALPPSPNCAIKGNVNWSGKCIFHTPDGNRYKRIKMEARFGDRWFCTPIEAISSGCREAKR
jgi:endonuclease YncB( thermonuclease family)